MERWQVVTAIIFAYLAVTLGIGLLSGRKASKSAPLRLLPLGSLILRGFTCLPSTRTS